MLPLNILRKHFQTWQGVGNMSKSYRRSYLGYEDDLERYYNEEYKYKKNTSIDSKRRKINYNNVNDIMRSIDNETDEVQQK